MDYFADALDASISARHREEAYRVYLTDTLYSLCAFTGNKPARRYYDLLHPVPEDTRSGMEIAVERLEALGIKVVDHESESL